MMLQSDRSGSLTSAGNAIAYPKPEPVLLPAMYQSWRHLTFLHWRFPLETVQRRVPRPLEVECFDGAAWVGVTPFVVEDLRPPLLPPLPWISRFPETNCRTYVRAPDGKSGVWFFSLDCARLPAVAGARFLYSLPYFWSRMRIERRGSLIRYQSSRVCQESPVTTDIEIEHGKAIEQHELEIFFTARFRLFSFLGPRLTYTKVEHAPWPLAEARVIRADQNLIAAAGLPQPKDPPVVHFSEGVRVRVAMPRRVR